MLAYGEFQYHVWIMAASTCLAVVGPVQLVLRPLMAAARAMMKSDGSNTAARTKPPSYCEYRRHLARPRA
jgi:hypothetical protein